MLETLDPAQLDRERRSSGAGAGAGLLQHHLGPHDKLRRASLNSTPPQMSPQRSGSDSGELAAETAAAAAAAVAAGSNLRQRVARARRQSSFRKAHAVVGQWQSPKREAADPDGPQQEPAPLQLDAPQQPGAAMQQAPLAPSLPALTLVVKMLLSLAAAKVSPSLAQQLRVQVLQQIKAAAAAAKEAGQPFSVSESLHTMLPGLRAAVLAACSQQEAAASAAAAAALETALTTAACEAQLCGLALSPAGGAAAAGGSGARDMEAILADEMASAMSAML